MSIMKEMEEMKRLADEIVDKADEFVETVKQPMSDERPVGNGEVKNTSTGRVEWRDEGRPHRDEGTGSWTGIGW